jgi:hypothetical protein
MPFGKALIVLMGTGRVYKTETSLMDPRTGREWPALAPRAIRSEPPIAEVERGPAAAPRLLPQVASATG